MSERTFVNVREAAKKFGVELSRAAQDAAARMEAGITTTYQSVAKAVKKATRQASPSKDAAEAGENIGIGAIQGINEGGKEAKSAGRAIGTSVRTQAQQDALMVASRTKAAYKNDSTLNMLTIQRKQAEMMGANTAAIEQEILARRATIAAQVKEQVATESAARIKASQPFTGSAPLPAGYQGPIGPNDKRKGVGFGSKIAAGAKNIGGKIMGGGIGASMGIGAAGMAVGMIPGMEGVGQAISMASMIPMLLPMLMNPIGATVAALGLLTVGIFALNAAQEENRKKQIALGNASVMSTNKMIEISKSLGTVSATESRQSKRANIAGISQENQSQASTFMESEAGKQFVTDINSQKDAGKTDKEVAESTSRDLANLVLQGVMDEGMAKAILQDSAAKTGNYELSNSMGNLSTLVEGGATAASGAALKSAETATSKGYFGEMKYGNSFISLKDVPKLQAASIETANAFSQITGQQDVLASQFETGKISLEDYRSGMKELQSDQAKAIDLANTQQRVLGSEYDTTFMQNVKDTFGEESPAYKTAEKLKEIGDSDFKTSMMLNLESGQMTPDQVNQLLDMGTSAQTNFQATVDLIGQGPTLDLMTRLTQQGYTALEIQTVLANPQQAKEITDTLTLIEDLTSDGPITMETLIKKDSQFASLKSEADWFNSLPAVQQRYFLSIYKTIKDSDVSGNIAKKKGIIDKNGNITMSADRAEKKITKADMDKERTRLAKADTVKEIKAGTFNEVGGDGGGGGGTTDKASAALSILGRKEEKINKAYDERLKALDKIQQANEKINQQKKDQLDLADALSKGDIGAAARAQQQARENAQATALQQQRDQMNAAKEAQIAALRVNGMSREQLEAYQANEANKKDLSALGKWAGAKGFAIGGMVPKTQYFSIGGKPKGTDTISAMLTPGEFVVKKSAVDKLGAGTMKKINNGQLPGGNSVYNYSISVNVKSDADADQIANAVLTKIQKIDNQAMRGDKA
jgi:hypothetical protein